MPLRKKHRYGSLGQVRRKCSMALPSVIVVLIQDLHFAVGRNLFCTQDCEIHLGVRKDNFMMTKKRS